MRVSFELEKFFFYKNEYLDSIINQRHIFITSLPRSGTTILLNYFNEIRDYASLTYQDMPFIFSPNIWGKIKLNNSKELHERIHGDRIMINNNSPEGLDEIYWKNFSEYKIEEYINYISLILKKNNKKKYLSKNNYNIFRIGKLTKLLPSSLFIIPFRHPLEQSNSLLNQHLKFIKYQEEDNFVLEYMNFLNHREFGKNYEPYFKSNNYFDYTELDHWIEQWKIYYKKILEEFKKNKSQILLINYNRICDDKKYLDKFNDYFGIKEFDKDKYFKNVKKQYSKCYTENHLRECNELFNELDEYSLFA